MDEKNEKMNINESEIDEKIRQLEAAITKYSEKALEEKKKEELLASKEKIVSSAFKKKVTAFAFVMLISLVALVSSTFAYFTASVTSGGNIIATGAAEFEIVDLLFENSGEGSLGSAVIMASNVFPGDKIERQIYASNAGDVSLYVRAKIDYEITLDERYAERADEIDYSLVSCISKSDSWVKSGEYYYYERSIGANSVTPSLIDTISFSPEIGNMYKNAVFKITVTFEAVQSHGNGANVFEAVGWKTNSEGGAGA